MRDPEGLVGDTKEVTGDTMPEEVNVGTGDIAVIKESLEVMANTMDVLEDGKK